MQNYLVVLSGNQMGQGNEELGSVLMKAFLSALSQDEVLPDEILLYNAGVLLAKNGEDSAETLQELADKGVKIKSCGTCVNYYNMEAELAVGEVTNMRYILEQMRTSQNLVQP